MPRYCYRCRNCGVRWEGDFAGQHCTSPDVIRDYRAEAVGIGSGVRTSDRPATNREMAEKFLPTARDFKQPGDPDGTKGLRDWADSHDPKPGNKRPVYPEGVPRRSY